MSIYTKLLEIQKKHLAFEKDAKNPFFKSNYVSLDSIVEKLTPLLDEQKLVVFHYTQNNEVVTEVVDTELVKDEDIVFKQSIKSSFPLIESNDPQKLWSCISYAKRYNLSQLFNIITDRDDDWNEASWNYKKEEIKKEESENEYNDDWKEWFNNPELEKLEANKDKFKDADEAIKTAKAKYKLSKVMEENIRKLFN